MSIAATRPAPSHPQLAAELEKIYDTDTEARAKFTKDSGINVTEKQLTTFSRKNQKYYPRLKAIIREFKWPGYSKVGEEGTHYMGVLVQRCDAHPKFQKRCLGFLRNAVAAGDAPKEDLAYLTDRVLRNENKPQLYGTQFEKPPLFLYPIENSSEVDLRREKMGLPALKIYMDHARAKYARIFFNAELFEEIKTKYYQVKKILEESPRSSMIKQLLMSTIEEYLLRLKEIINQFGWPGHFIVTKEGSSMMRFLVEHCNDLEFQKQCSVLFREAIEIGNASAEDGEAYLKSLYPSKTTSLKLSNRVSSNTWTDRKPGIFR